MSSNYFTMALCSGDKETFYNVIIPEDVTAHAGDLISFTDSTGEELYLLSVEATQYTNKDSAEYCYAAMVAPVIPACNVNECYRCDYVKKIQEVEKAC